MDAALLTNVSYAASIFESVCSYSSNIYTIKGIISQAAAQLVVKTYHHLTSMHISKNASNEGDNHLSLW